MPLVLTEDMFKSSDLKKEEKEEKKEIIRVALDCDGVLRDFCKQFTHVYLKQYPQDAGKIKPPEEWEDWKLESNFPRLGKRAYEFMNSRAKEVFFLAPPIVGAVDAFRTLKRAGFHLLVISSQKPDIQIYTTKWLESMGLFVEELYFTEDKFKYVGYFDLIVEDSPKNICNIYEAGGKVIIFDHKYNRGDKIPLDIEINSFRSYGWRDIVRYLLSPRLDEPLIQKLYRGWS